MQDNQQQQQQRSIVLKLRHEDDIRRIRVDAPEGVSFEELQKLIGSLYVDTQMDSVVLKYEDEDGDKLSITSSLEWQEAVRYFFSKEAAVFSVFLLPRHPAAKVDESESDSDDDDDDDDEEGEEVTLEDICNVISGALKDLGIDGEVTASKEEQPFVPPFLRNIFHPHHQRQGPCVPPPPFHHRPHPHPHPHAQAPHRRQGPPCMPPFAAFHHQPQPHPHPHAHPHFRPHPYHTRPQQPTPTPPGFGACPRRGPCGPRGGFYGRPFPHCPVQQQQPQQAQQPQPNAGGCTYATTGSKYAPHSAWFNCLTCGLVGPEGCCQPCAASCHQGHALVARGPSPAFYCDCGAGAHGLKCQSLHNKKKEEEKVEVPSTEEGLMRMKVAQLKAVLDARGVSYADCVDKLHLVEKIRSTSPSTDNSNATASRAEELIQLMRAYAACNSEPVVATPAAQPEEEAAPAPPVEEADASYTISVEAAVVEDEAKAVEDEVKVNEEENNNKEEPVKGEEEDNENEEESDDDTNNFGAETFRQKLEFLRAMGFTDQDRNIAALVEHAGNLNGAVAALINEEN